RISGDRINDVETRQYVRTVRWILLRAGALWARLLHRLRVCVRRLTGKSPSTKTSAMPVTPDIVPVYLHPHAAANEPVTLHQGPVAIQGGNTGTGALTLRWLPSTGLRLEADLNSTTPGPKQASAFGFPPHVADLRYGGWRIRLTAVQQFREIFKSLGETGGYAFTHLGRLERDGSSLFGTRSSHFSTSSTTPANTGTGSLPNG
ncbi:MAG: hypothetical protein LC753_09675, partial [Acidobacteria bacterium]|nr:hypothetical protein [Acidobacteriota bacterium]MCA1650524.1 hypothetical protein [Acidobacteriota bacterium]